MRTLLGFVLCLLACGAPSASMDGGADGDAQRVGLHPDAGTDAMAGDGPCVSFLWFTCPEDGGDADVADASLVDAAMEAADDTAVDTAADDALPDVPVADDGADTGTDTAATCPTGYFPCHGLCVDDHTSNPAFCGVCGNVCPTQTGSETACANGFCHCYGANLGKIWCFGACTDAQTDPANCGQCHVVCAAGQSCSAGVCQ